MHYRAFYGSFVVWFKKAGEKSIFVLERFVQSFFAPLVGRSGERFTNVDDIGKWLG